MSTAERLAVVALLVAGGAVAQQIPTEPTEPVRLGLRTVAAPCELPDANLLRMKDQYKALLLGWLAGADAARELDVLWQQTVDRAARFEVTDVTVRRLPTMPSGRIIVPAIGCQERIEMEVLRALVTRDPETTATLFAFYLQVYRLQITPPPPRRWLASRSRDRLLWLVTQYKQVARGGREGRARRARRARMLLLLADVMRDAPFHTEILEARSLVDRILDLDPELTAARYMAATLSERTGDYEAAVRELGRLSKRLPEDTEVALRLAINRGREGDEKAARSAMQQLARGDGEEWIRRLGFQEWARLAATHRGTDMGTVLEEALEAFPDDRQLTLQLAAFHVGAGEWARAEELAARSSSGRDGDEDPSPRLRYDIPRRYELDVVAGVVAAEVEAGRERLRSLLPAIE